MLYPPSPHTHTEVIELLLEHGAPVKEKNTLGWTPLDEALSYGNKDTSEFSIGTF